MFCPKCYGKVDKASGMCKKCGFQTAILKESSNKKAKELMRSGDGDLVVQSRVLPHDLSKKNLALLCGFLGLFGAHYFYVGKMFKGLINLVTTVFSIIFMIMYVLKTKLTLTLAYIEYFVAIVFAYILVQTIFDFINILFNRFKVPVYFEEKKR